MHAIALGGKAQLKHACNRIPAKPTNDYVCTILGKAHIIMHAIAFRPGHTSPGKYGPKRIMHAMAFGGKTQ